MKKSKPKEEYGYYCDLCGSKICKYSLDLNRCGAIFVTVEKVVGIGKNEIRDLVEKDICHNCAKLIAEEVVDEF